MQIQLLFVVLFASRFQGECFWELMLVGLLLYIPRNSYFTHCYKGPSIYHVRTHGEGRKRARAGAMAKTLLLLDEIICTCRLVKPTLYLGYLLGKDILCFEVL